MATLSQEWWMGLNPQVDGTEHSGMMSFSTVAVVNNTKSALFAHICGLNSPTALVYAISMNIHIYSVGRRVVVEWACPAGMFVIVYRRCDSAHTLAVHCPILAKKQQTLFVVFGWIRHGL